MTMWIGVVFNVWNSSFRSENGELGLSVGSGIGFQHRGLEYFNILRWFTVQINANCCVCFRLRMTDISGDVRTLHQYTLYDQPA